MFGKIMAFVVSYKLRTHFQRILEMKIKSILITLITAFAIGLGAYSLYGITSEGNIAQASAENREEACALSHERGKTLDPKAVGDVAAFRALNEPLDLTYIKFNDIDGNPKSLADWKGQYVLFNLWATWCPPCRAEMALFNNLQKNKGSDEFSVVPVSIDHVDENPRDFYEFMKLDQLPFLQDSTMQAFHSLRKKGVALGMPTTVLIDTNGCGLGVLVGPAHWDSPDAVNLIDATLALEKLG